MPVISVLGRGGWHGAEARESLCYVMRPCLKPSKMKEDGEGGRNRVEREKEGLRMEIKEGGERKAPNRIDFISL